MAILKNSLGQSHEIIEKIVCKGDYVVDATAGNGNDTVFLAGLVGDSGKVYSFDIQTQAIINTGKKVDEMNLSSRVEVINDGHHNLDYYVKEKIKAAVFNLGYLPGGNHSIATKAETTITAIKKALELITLNGMVIVVIYYGGDSGFEEKEAVMEYFTTIDHKHYSVMKNEFINQPNCPPILVCIEKYCEYC